MASSNDDQDASLLISTLTNEATRSYGTGSMSSSVYDSAWVSMVSRTTSSGTHWLFPECLQYILDTQSPDGGWTSYASQVDGILNTAAALLALVCHNTEDLYERNSALHSTIQNRISVARRTLDFQLQKWDVNACDHVGFEVLVPALLSFLEAKIGVQFNFPGKESLLKLNADKLLGFKPEMMYGESQITALHTLEAFVGTVDFDKVAHHKFNGAILGSPAATAAYLMNCTVWDNDSEAYLRMVIADGAGKGSGGVPCAFPTTIFETTWVLSTLLKSGFSTKSLGAYNLEKLASVLELEFEKQDGLVGFAPSLLPDADDTAKTILTLCLLDRPVSPDQMVSKYEEETHFRTYENEKTSSFSANCNVLDALLHIEDPGKYTKQILKTAEFLCKAWYADKVSDKWNLSSQYSMMLLMQAFRRLMVVWDSGTLAGLPDELVTEQIPLVMIQVLHQTLHWQTLEGCWTDLASETYGYPCETTSYAVLTIVAASRMPWTAELDSQAFEAIRKGAEFLQLYKEKWGNASYIWVEKVSYGSSVLSKTYCLAASKAAVIYADDSACSFSTATRAIFNIPTEKVSSYDRFFSALPMFQNDKSWKTRASLIEAMFFLPRLQRERLKIFPRKNMKKDKYLDYIPFTWIGCNNKGGFLRTDLLWDMMMISMLNYQVDEFMETVAGKDFTGDLTTIEYLVRSLFDSEHTAISSNGDTPTSSNGSMNGHDGREKAAQTETGNVEGSDLQSIKHTLTKFTTHILNHPKIFNITANSHHFLSNQLEHFLLAHLTQSTDNKLFSHQPQSETKQLTFPTTFTFWNWVRTTGSTHTSCPYSWTWISCHMESHDSSHPFPSSVSKYLAEELCAHLATMCRMSNDYGSLARDKAEKNLNSINFPEFNMTGDLVHAEEGGGPSDVERGKMELLELIEYERSCLMAAKERLFPLLSACVRDVINVFIDVTDLYGQIYVARDIASRM